MNAGHAKHARLIPCPTFAFSLILIFACSTVQVEAAAPITPSGLNTQVTLSTTPPAGKTQYDITGGTRPGGGVNLFHSFGDFNVPINNIANFLNDSGLSTSNILGRVTGGNISNIFGAIQTTGFGNANLFLMNPAGFLFGPNSTVNVGGMVSFTTADYLRLTDNVRFNAIPGPADALLTAAPVVAFGFLGSNPGAITVQGSQLTVTEGAGISLTGGNITIQSGTPDNGPVQSAKLSAPGGQISLASVASSGEILAGTLAQAPNINGQSFGNLGSVQISEQSIIDVSGLTGGKISIRSGRLLIDNASLQSTTVLGDSGGIEIASSAMSMKGGSIQTSTAGPGTAGGITIDAHTLSMSDGALIASLVLPPGAGNGGNIRANATESISISGFRPGNTSLGPIPVTNLPSGLYTQTVSAGRGGNIDVTTPQLHLQGGLLRTQSFGLGRAGDNVATVGRLDVTEGGQLSSITFSAGDGGNVTVTATDSIHILGQRQGIFGVGNVIATDYPSAINTNTTGIGKGGQLAVSTPALEMQTGVITAQTTGAGQGGVIAVDVDELSLTKGAVITSSTFGIAPGGSVSVNATGTISISGRSGITYSVGQLVFTNNQSTIATSTFGAGPSGQITLSARNLVITDQAQISAATGGVGPAGTISISVEDALIDGVKSGIFTNTVETGAGGNVTLSVQSLTVQNDGTISAATSGPAPSATGGTITINADQAQVNSGGLITASTTGAGPGGSVNINASDNFSSTAGTVSSTARQATGGDINIVTGNSVTLGNGASISASSTGAGKAGNIQITVGNQFTMSNSSVTTEASQSGGGLIKITTNPSGTVQLSNSKISASVLDGTGGGGSVDIDPQFVILQNSQILAQAVQGPGGNIGITITNGGLFLPDATSVVSASSQFGQSGTVTIQAPIAPAGGKIQPLGKAPLQVTALLSQRCAAIARGEVSSFVVAGRDTLPTEPGGWLTSPLAFGSPEAGAVMQAEGPSVESESDNPTIVFLRRLPTSSMVAQLLGEDWVADCMS